MEKEFVPYQESLELKELGFDEPCFGFYGGLNPLGDRYFYNSNGYNRNSDIGTSEVFHCTRILYQQAFRWFRDKKLCDGSVCRHGQADGNYSYRWDILHEYGVYEERHFKQGYTTYEEAELACLKKLIEIVKTK